MQLLKRIDVWDRLLFGLTIDVSNGGCDWVLILGVGRGSNGGDINTAPVVDADDGVASRVGG